jgi:hypothetical protein
VQGIWKMPADRMRASECFRARLQKRETLFMNLNKILQLVGAALEEDLNQEFQNKSDEVQTMLNDIENDPNKLPLKMTRVRANLIYTKGILDDAILEIDKYYKDKR